MRGWGASLEVIRKAFSPQPTAPHKTKNAKPAKSENEKAGLDKGRFLFPLCST